VTYLLKARTVKPERQPLLANGTETFVSRQRSQTAGSRGKSPHETVEILLETVFCMGFVPRYYKDDNWSKNDASRVEAGSNISTVTLRVVGGDEKGSLESETVKYGHESHETRTRK
jgi:hypothetical protein